jgi:hypothetical protein
MQIPRGEQNRERQHEPMRPRHEGHMSRGQIFEWYKRQGLLAVYFMLYPQG